MDKAELLEKLAKINKDRHWLAEMSKYDYRTVNNKLGPSGKISPRMMAAFERAILEEERRRNIPVNKPDASVWDLVMFTGKEVTQINEGRRIGGYEKVEDLYHDAVISFCDDLIAKEKLGAIEPSNITEMPKKKAHIQAAAGSGIMAEVIDWEGDNDIVHVQINGQSMSPKFEDGDVIDMMHKKASRSPFMKKGLIYLVQYEGGWMVKRYNTRKARPEEKDAEYLTDRGTVGILESINPDFPPIDITSPCDWSAWFNEK